jgi:NAD(P)-dependent dehydrogenase (short-subunit alcohol dehydrogenase family)
MPWSNAGIFLVKPFIEYTAEEFRALVSTNLAGFVYITQLALKQMLIQKSDGSVASITAAVVDNPMLARLHEVAPVMGIPFKNRFTFLDRVSLGLGVDLESFTPAAAA